MIQEVIDSTYRIYYTHNRTCFECPVKFSTKIGHEKRVLLQRWGKINMKSKELHERLHKMAF